MLPYAGIDLIEVQPGTEIEHEGEKLTVTDESAVRLGRKMYVTPKVMGALNAKFADGSA